MANNKVVQLGNGLKVASVTSYPSNPQNGTIVYRSDLNSFQAYENGVWKAMITAPSTGSSSITPNMLDFSTAAAPLTKWNLFDLNGSPLTAASANFILTPVAERIYPQGGVEYKMTGTSYANSVAKMELAVPIAIDKYIDGDAFELSYDIQSNTQVTTSVTDSAGNVPLINTTETILFNSPGNPNIGDIVSATSGNATTSVRRIKSYVYPNWVRKGLSKDFENTLNAAIGTTNFSTDVYGVALQSDNKVIIYGFFSSYAGTAGRNKLVRLNADGTLDTAFCANAVDGSKFNGTVSNVEIQSDGKILVGGAFSSYAGTAGRNKLVRLNADGTVDTTFCANAVDSTKFTNSVSALKIQPDGKILVGGIFLSYAAAGRDRLIRLNADGTLDTAFCANAVDGSKITTGQVRGIYLDSSNNIFVIGSITYPSGTGSPKSIIKLSSTGAIDNSFVAGTGTKLSGSVYDMVVDTSNIYIVGNFTAYNGTAGRNSLVKLDLTGATVDTTFATNAVDGTKFNNPVHYITKLKDGRILVGGNFTNYNGYTGRNLLVSLMPNGLIDSEFCNKYSDSKFAAGFVGVRSISNSIGTNLLAFFGDAISVFPMASGASANISGTATTNVSIMCDYIANYNSDETNVLTIDIKPVVDLGGAAITTKVANIILKRVALKDINNGISQMQFGFQGAYNSFLNLSNGISNLIPLNKSNVENYIPVTLNPPSWASYPVSLAYSRMNYAPFQSVYMSKILMGTDASPGTSVLAPGTYSISGSVSIVNQIDGSFDTGTVTLSAYLGSGGVSSVYAGAYQATLVSGATGSMISGTYTAQIQPTVLTVPTSTQLYAAIKYNNTAPGTATCKTFLNLSIIKIG